MTKREKNIACVVAGLLAVLLLNWYLITPYLGASAAVNRKLVAAHLELAHDQRLLATRGRVALAWRTLLKTGLGRDADESENQTLQALLQYAHTAGLTIASLKPDRMVYTHGFEQIRVQAVGRGSTAAVALLMWFIETAKLPLHINEIRLVAGHAGVDDLNIELSVAALVVAPPQSQEGPS